MTSCKTGPYPLFDGPSGFEGLLRHPGWTLLSQTIKKSQSDTRRWMVGGNFVPWNIGMLFFCETKLETIDEIWFNVDVMFHSIVGIGNRSKKEESVDVK